MTDDGSNAAPDPVELSLLGPHADVGRTNALIAQIVADGLLARRARADSIVVQVNRWWRPALAAAVLVLAVSIPLAVESSRRLARAVPVTDTTPADRWGLPASVANLVSGHAPTAMEIVAAFDTRWAVGSQ